MKQFSIILIFWNWYFISSYVCNSVLVRIILINFLSCFVFIQSIDTLLLEFLYLFYIILVVRIESSTLYFHTA